MARPKFALSRSQTRTNVRKESREREREKDREDDVNEAENRFEEPGLFVCTQPRTGRTRYRFWQRFSSNQSRSKRIVVVVVVIAASSQPEIESG